MSVVTLRPNAAGVLRGSWTTTGAGGVNWAALSDDIVTTYTALSAAYTANASGGQVQLNLGTTTIPTGARVKSVTPWATIARTGSTARKVNMRLHNPTVLPKADWQNTSTHTLTTTPTKYVGITETTEIVKGLIAIAPPLISQATLNAFQVEVYGMTTTDVRVYEMGLDVVIDNQPTTTSLSVGGLGDGSTITATRTPTITWDFSDDLESQTKYQVEIYTSTNVLVFQSGEVTSSNDFHFLTEPLTNGSYFIRVRTAQKWTGAGGDFWSNWATMSFSINLPNPAIPAVYAVEDDANGRVAVAVYNKLNLLSNSQAQPESNSWDYLLDSATLTDETSASYVHSGGNSIKVTFTNFSPSLGTYPSIRVSEGQIYGAAAYVRKLESSSARPAFIGIDYYDEDLDYINSTDGLPVTENGDLWTKIEVKGTAPANAYYASLTVYFTGGGAGSVHYVDSPILVALETLVTDIPAWSRGGLATDTPNLLSYADSTMEGSYNWQANDPASLISVDPVSADLNTVQGTLALTMETVATAGRRDSETGFTAAGTSVVINKGDVVSGDLMIAVIGVNNTSAGITPPAGWTKLGNNDAGTAVRSDVYYKVAGGSEPTTYTFTLSVSSKAAGWIYSYSGINTTTPIFASANAVVTTSSTVFTMPTANTPHNGVLIEAVVGVRAASASGTTWTSNLGAGAATEAQISTTANTANEIALGGFVQLQNTKTTSDTALSGKTMTSSATLTAAVKWTIVLQPTRTTVRADLAGTTIKYAVNPGEYYAINAAIYGGNNNSANRRFSVWMDLFDASGTFVTAYGYRPYAVPGKWVNGGSVIPIPNNPAITQASLRLEIDQMTNLETYYVDAMSLYPSTEYLGYYEGYRDNDGPYIETQYSEDGENWYDMSPVAVASVEPGNAVDMILDYEVNDKNRIYRSRNVKTEDGVLYVSEWAETNTSVNLNLDRVWLHARLYPEDTAHKFNNDEGRGRSETLSNAGTEVRLYGREYPIVQFSARTERSFSVSLRCLNTENDDADLEAFKVLAATKGEIFYRDARSRRYTGWMDGIQFTDEVWGTMVSFTFKVAGIQP